MSKSLANSERIRSTSIIFKDGQVTWLSCWSTTVVCLKRVVSLENCDIRSGISSEFSNFEELNIRELIPLCISRGVLGDPNVITVSEISSSVVCKDRNCVRTVSCNGHIIESITIEICNSNVNRITICSIVSGSGSACICCECCGGRNDHYEYQK